MGVCRHNFGIKENRYTGKHKCQNGKDEMNYTVELIKSRRRTIGFQIKQPGVLTVRAPYGVPQREIDKIIARHEEWIQKQMEVAAARAESADRQQASPKYTKEEIREMVDQGRQKIPPRVQAYAERMGVTYGKITIRSMKTRWGSCTAQGNISLNCLLTLVPEAVMDYVIVHELCHRIEMNHSSRFWRLVETVLPDYKIQKQWLKEHGADLVKGLE